MPKAIKSIGMDAMKFCHGKSRNGDTALREQSAVQSELCSDGWLGKAARQWDGLHSQGNGLDRSDEGEPSEHRVQGCTMKPAIPDHGNDRDSLCESTAWKAELAGASPAKQPERRGKASETKKVHWLSFPHPFHPLHPCESSIPSPLLPLPFVPPRLRVKLLLFFS